MAETQQQQVNRSKPRNKKPMTAKAKIEIPDFTRDWLKLKLSFSFYDGRHASEKAAEAAARAEGADIDRVEAKIVAITRKALSPVSAPMAKMKALWHYSTRPWEDGGWRLVKATDYPKLRTQLEELQREVTDAIREIIRKKYDDLYAEAKKHLNGLLEDKFPSREKMLERYAVRIFVEQLPNIDNRISGLDAKQVEAIMAERMATLTEQINAGNAGLLSDIAKTVEDLHKTLADPEKKFQGTPESGFPIFANVRSMVDRCEYLNVAKDPKITALIAKIRKAMDSIDPEQVKADKLARKDGAQKVKSIMDELASF